MNVIEDITPRIDIPIPAIHSALQREWTALSAEAEQQTGSPALRANTLTLVVIAQHGAEADTAREMLYQLASAIPSRILLFVVNSESQAPAATIWAHCTLTPSGKQGGCFDVIEVALPPNRIRAIPNIVAVHRLGELPTFVVWFGEADIGSADFGAVASVADRLILDTETFDNPLGALRDYARFLGTTGAGVLGGDLAWRRISTWRELIAQSFDPPGTRDFAMNIRSVDITYDHSQTSGAILLASWLISRLGLTPESVSDSHSTVEMRANTGESSRRVTVNLHRSHRAGAGIRSARILARSGEAVVRISIFAGEGGTSTARVESPGMPRQERVFHHVNAPRHEVLAAELMRFKRGSIFEGALSVAAEFCHIMESKQE